MGELSMFKHELSNIDLVRLLPDSLKNDPDAKAMMQVVSEQLQKIYVKILPYIGLDIPANMLDLVAYEKHVDFYDVTLSEEQKRELIKKSKAFHKKKGTPAAVEEVVSTVYPGGKVTEWYEYGGQPFHFKVEVDSPIGVNIDLALLTKMIESVKRKTAVLDAIQFNSIIPSDQKFFGSVSTTSVIDIR
jgi:phage tail P2-like protein